MDRSTTNVMRHERFTWLARRTLWAVLFGLHAAWVVRLGVSGDATAFRLITMSLGVGFLGLKTFDVPWLRLLCTRRALVAGLLVVIILHVGVMDRALFEPGDSSLWFVPILVSLSVCLKPLWVMTRKVVVALTRAASHLHICSRSAFRESLWKLAIGGPQFLPHPLRVLRGPPANAQ